MSANPSSGAFPTRGERAATASAARALRAILSLALLAPLARPHPNAHPNALGPLPEGPVVELASAAQTLAEGGGTAQVVVQLSELHAAPVDVPFTLGGSAVAPGDYTAPASPLTIPAGVLSATIDVPLVPDLLHELDETVVVTLGDPSVGTLGATTVHTLTVTDDDAPPVVTFALASSSVAEGAGSAALTVQIDALSGLDVEVPFSLGGTAVAPDDLGAPASPIVIAAGQGSVQLVLALVQDVLDEEDEQAVVDLGTPTGGTLGATAQHVLTIVDDDPQPAVGFAVASSTVAEGLGQATLAVQLDAPSGRTVEVPFTVGGSADVPEDADVPASPLVLLPGQTAVDLVVTLVDDSLDEAAEDLVVTLGAPQNADAGAVTQHVLTLEDDDPTPAVSFSAASSSAGEGAGSVVLSLQLDAASGRDVEVPFTLSGTAEAPDDCTIDASPLVLPAGETSADLVVQIVQDDLHEPDEELVVTLGTPLHAELGAIVAHSLSLIDDEPTPAVAFPTPTSDVSEAAAQTEIVVTLSGPSALPVDVPFTIGGSATSPGDYIADSSPITIPAGELSGTLLVIPNPDTLYEGDETIVITLGAPTNAELGPTLEHLLTLVEDDPAPSVAFFEPVSSLPEDVAQRLVTVELSTVSGLPVEVPYVLSGDAQSPLDYTADASPLVVPAGQTSGEILVTVVNDEESEPTEKVVLTLLAPEGATLGGTVEHRLRILDDDGPLWKTPQSVAPRLVVDATEVDLGHALRGESSAPTTLQVTNPSQQPLRLEALVAAGAGARELSVVPAEALPFVLPGGASTTVDVALTPKQAMGPLEVDLRVVQRPHPARPWVVRARGVAYGPTGGEMLVDCGAGSGHDGPSGERWSKDFAFTLPSQTQTILNPVAGASDPEVYGAVRRGAAFGYRLPLPDGPYDVTLHLAETQLIGPGTRTFDVSLEESLVLDGLDLAALVGTNVAYEPTFRVEVTDGELTVDLVGELGEALLFGLQVRSMALLEPDSAQLDFGALGQGQNATLDLTLVNGGLHPLQVDRVGFLVSGGTAQDFQIDLEGALLSGGDLDVVHDVDVAIAPGGAVVVPVTFSPAQHSTNLVALRFEGNFAAQEVQLFGDGGSGTDPFLHVVMETAPLIVDYASAGSVDVLLDGASSHTHEPGHALTAYEWKDGQTILGNLATLTAPLAVGHHDLTLTIWDDNQPPRVLTDGRALEVYPVQSVPGVLAHYYHAAPGTAASLLDTVPNDADWAELREDFLVLQEDGVGGSGLLDKTLVVLRGLFEVEGAGTWTVSPQGGADTRVVLDGQPHTSPTPLAAGTHSLEVRWAVETLQDLPLDVRLSVDGGPATAFAPDALFHDESSERPVINTMPGEGIDTGGNLVVIEGFGFFPEPQVTVHWGAVDLTAADLTSYAPDRLEFFSPPGTGVISVRVETPAGLSNARTFEYSPDGPTPIQFQYAGILGVADPTAAAFGPDGRFYVATRTGHVKAFTLDEDYVMTGEALYPGVSGLSNHEILGLAFDPFDAASPVRIYVAHSRLYAQNGQPPVSPDPYTGQISVLTGPAFDAPTPLVTGLPVSNHDHGVNGLVFDDNGDLLVCVGGNTNAGVTDDAIGGIPESPLSGSIVKVRTSQPGFDGNVQYYDEGTTDLNMDQLFGEAVDLAPNADVEVWVSGLRNAFDLVLTTRGLVYATDNGPNYTYGPSSTGPDTQGPEPYTQDEVVLAERGNYYGHPNRNRGRHDPRQNVFHEAGSPTVPDVHTAALEVVPSSSNGICEYRSEAFRGGMRGDLLVQDWESTLKRLTLDGDGREVESAVNVAWTHALAVCTGPGGAILAADYSWDRVELHLPLDAGVVGVTPYEITPWRAPRAGGTPFVIGGENFGTLADTTVTIGGVTASLTSVTSRRIHGTVPAHPGAPDRLVDVVVTVAGQSKTLEEAFRYLRPRGEARGYWATEPEPPAALGEVAAGVLAGRLLLVGEGDPKTYEYDLQTRLWSDWRAPRPFPGHHHSAETIGGKLYLVGGLDGGSEGRLQVYDPVANQWTLKAPLPWSGGSVSTAVIDGKLYACGGIVGPFTTVENCAVYDPVTNAWTPRAPMPSGQGRNHAAAATDGERLWIFGGRGPGSGDGNWVDVGFDSVHVYDPLTDSWESSTAPGSTLAALPQRRGGMGKAVWYHDEFYVFGGETIPNQGLPPNGVYSRVDVYDPATNTWRLEAPLPTARHGIYPVQYGNRILIPAGGVTFGASQSDVFEVFWRH